MTATSARLAEVGFDQPYGVPLSLKRQVSAGRGVEHFLEGDLRVDGDTLIVDTRMYDSRNARLVDPPMAPAWER